MQPAETAALIHRNLDLLNSGDVAGTASMFAPGVVVEALGMGIRLEGRDAYMAYQEQLFTAFPDFHGQILSITTEGSRAVVEYVFEGTHDGPLVLPNGTIPSSGRRVVMQFAAVVEFDENEQAASVRQYTNPLGLLTQLGVIDAPALTS